MVLLTLPEKPSTEALERFSARFRAWLTNVPSGAVAVSLKWQAPILEITLRRPPRSANLAAVLEGATEELGMFPLKVGYR